jgi:hypothetical protein
MGLHIYAWEPDETAMNRHRVCVATDVEVPTSSRRCDLGEHPDVKLGEGQAYKFHVTAVTRVNIHDGKQLPGHCQHSIPHMPLPQPHLVVIHRQIGPAQWMDELLRATTWPRHQDRSELSDVPSEGEITQSITEPVNPDHIDSLPGGAEHRTGHPTDM